MTSTSASASSTGARRLVAVSAGLSQPSSTRLLVDRLAAATEAALRAGGLEPATEVVEVRDVATDLTNNLMAGFPSERLQGVLDTVLGADGLIAVSPTFNASYSGLFKLFFDAIDHRALAGMPVLIGATGGTARHSLVLDHALRPLFTYLGALVLPTGVFAAAEDWGEGSMPADSDLASRIERAGGELARAMAAGERRAPPDPFEDPTPFEELLRGSSSG
ncbi:MAG TPA: FMN reductase [Candidatus Limnocylindria bacterium]|nr:FMN reductase [Candidatus Limnocylindria bacterium]